MSSRPSTRQSAPARRPPAVFIVLLTAMSVLPVNIYLPALPRIADELHAGTALMTLAVAGYAFATATAEIIAGFLSDRFGRRPVALVAVVLFIVASLGCAAAPTVEVFLVCRALQASIAACFSVAMVVIKETSDPGSQSQAVKRMGLAGTGWALAPMIAPVLGGVVAAVAGWRAIFVVLAALGVALLIGVVRLLPETSPSQGEGHRTGSALRGAGALLRSARFWAPTSCMVFSTATLYVFLAGAPPVMSSAVGSSSVGLGLYMALVPAGFVLGSYLVGRLVARMPALAALILARSVVCLGLGAAAAASQTVSLPAVVFFGVCALIGVGNGVTAPVVASTVMSVNAARAGTAAGLSAAAAIGGGAVISGGAGLVLSSSVSQQVLLGLLANTAVLALGAAVWARVTCGEPTTPEAS